MRAIDLNADIGEDSSDVDEQLIPLLTSASIACGGHAGDEASITRSIAACLGEGVRIGAHPSYPDRDGFGRRSIDIAPEGLRASLIEQVGALTEAAKSAGAEVSFMKPHGALYNDAAAMKSAAEPVMAVAQQFGLPLMILAGSPLSHEKRVPVIREGFMDRGYRSDGTLTPRGEEGALVTDSVMATRQSLTLAIGVDSLCVHSDTPGAVDILRAVRAALEDGGYTIGRP